MILFPCFLQHEKKNCVSFTLFISFQLLFIFSVNCEMKSLNQLEMKKKLFWAKIKMKKKRKNRDKENFL